MPPKAKYTREQIIKTAVNFVRQNGFNLLTARNLAQSLNSSPKPIFCYFKNMNELQCEIISYANNIYNKYINDAMNKGDLPPYKASGMAYILFAKEEKELFKLLFMRDRSSENIEENYEEIKPLINLIMQNVKISEQEARLFHLESWLYVHGIATMIATSYIDWDINFISDALTDMYNGLKHRFLERRK